MSDSKKKKEKKQKAATRKDLLEENKKLRDKLDYRKRKEKKLKEQLDALSKELRAALLSVGQQRDASRPTPLLTALPAPPVAPTQGEIASAAYHLYLERSRTGRGGTPESDWFQAQSLLWQKTAQKTHQEALRLSQPADSPEPLQSSG
ncbi:MAG: hypothetical protein AAF591_17490 [Verrucomicrobiota bacterium]